MRKFSKRGVANGAQGNDSLFTTIEPLWLWGSPVRVSEELTTSREAGSIRSMMLPFALVIWNR